MHFRPWTSFRSIDDVKYIPKYDHRNLLDPIFYFILFFLYKDPKDYKIQKNMNLTKGLQEIQPGTNPEPNHH